MKKNLSYGVLLMLILATLACRLPFFSRLLETPVVSTEASVLEELTIPVQQLTPTQTRESETTAALEPEVIFADPQVYSDNGVQIILPGSYVLGDVENDLAILVEGLQTLSEEESQDILALYELNKEDIVLWGYDTESPAQHMTSLLILQNDEFAGMSLAIISVFANTLLGDEVDSLSQERLTLGNRDVLRFLTTAENAGVETAQAIYLFNEVGKLWVVGFFTNQAQIDQRLPTFDAAVTSINFFAAE